MWPASCGISATGLCMRRRMSLVDALQVVADQRDERGHRGRGAPLAALLQIDDHGHARTPGLLGMSPRSIDPRSGD